MKSPPLAGFFLDALSRRLFAFALPSLHSTAARGRQRACREHCSWELDRKQEQSGANHESRAPGLFASLTPPGPLFERSARFPLVLPSQEGRSGASIRRASLSKEKELGVGHGVYGTAEPASSLRRQGFSALPHHSITTLEPRMPRSRSSRHKKTRHVGGFSRGRWMTSYAVVERLLPVQG